MYCLDYHCREDAAEAIYTVVVINVSRMWVFGSTERKVDSVTEARYVYARFTLLTLHTAVALM